MRLLWIGGGFGALTLAVIGVFVPVLPATPFILLAGACFARSSPKYHHWLRNHPRFGGLLRDWEEHRAIAGRTKAIAITMIVLVGGTSFWVLPWWQAQVALAVTLVGVVIYISTRRRPPRERSEASET